jgi:hypothetical protein
MKQTIKLDIQATSLNSAYYNDKRLGYNAATKKWIAELCRQLNHPINKAAMSELRLAFDPSKHCFTVFVDYYTPKFFNKDKQISAQSMDVGNITKTLLDVVFTPNFNGTGAYQCDNLNVDDKFITMLVTKKSPAKDFKTNITICVKKLPKNIRP